MSERINVSLMAQLVRGSSNRENIVREWFSLGGDLPRMACRILWKEKALASFRVFNLDCSPGFFYIKKDSCDVVTIDEGIERYNTQNQRAICQKDPHKVDPAAVAKLEGMEDHRCVDYTNLIIRGLELVKDGGYQRVSSELLLPATHNRWNFVGPARLTDVEATKAFRQQFYIWYPGCTLVDPNGLQNDAVSQDDIDDVMNSGSSLPSLD